MEISCAGSVFARPAPASSAASGCRSVRSKAAWAGCPTIARLRLSSRAAALLMVVTAPPAARRQFARHRVERVDERAELVVALRLDPLIQMARPDLARRRRQHLDRQ